MSGSDGPRPAPFDPRARLAARLVEGGWHERYAETTAGIAVGLARGLIGRDDPEAVYAEALAIVLDAAAEADDAPG